MVFQFKKLDSTNLRRAFLTSCAFLGAVGCLLIVTMVFEFFLDGILDNQLQKVIAKLPTGVHFKYEKVRTSLLTESVSLRGVTIKTENLPEPLFIQSMSIGGVDFATLIKIAETRRPALPSTIWFDLRGVEIHKTALPPNAVEFLDKLGVEAVDISIASSFRIDRAQSQIEIKNFTIEASHLAALQFSLDLTKFRVPSDSDVFQKAGNHDWLLAQTQDWRNTEVQSFQFIYNDDSLIPRLDHYLQESGEPPLRGFVAIIIDAQKSQTADPAQDNGFVTDALHKLWDFTGEPKSIGVVARPAKPVPLVKLLEDESITDFQSLGTLLGLKVELH